VVIDPFAVPEALLEGRWPARLSVRGVLKHLSWDCNQQRREFGLAPGINDNQRARLNRFDSISGHAEILLAGTLGRSAAIKPHRSSNSACST